MKKNSKRAGTRKPKIGNYYKINNHTIMKVLEISKGVATYVIVGEESYGFYQKWDYELFPECLDYVLTPLEVELL